MLDPPGLKFLLLIWTLHHTPYGVFLLVSSSVFARDISPLMGDFKFHTQKRKTITIEVIYLKSEYLELTLPSFELFLGFSFSGIRALV